MTDEGRRGGFAFKRTKIVCTLGPATDDEAVLRGLIASGMNVARLNLSHGALESHLARMEAVRRLADEAGEFVAIMFDTRGPDVRIGDLADESVTLVKGSEFTLTGEKRTGDATGASVTFPGLAEMLSPGDSVFLDDGLIELEVISSAGHDVRCRVVTGGVLKPHKGVNIPGKAMPLPILTDEDIHDLKEGARRGIDYIAASFLSRPDEIAEIRRAVAGAGGGDIQIIAKIESAQGVENLEGIIEAADGIMVARGDLGVEIPPEEVPGVQKRIIRLCREARKPVITATEMLESMTRSPRPTRAEITDVANAVLDGTSAVMLSQETAVGRYPVEAVKMMARICVRAEEDLALAPPAGLPAKPGGSVRAGIAHAACDLALNIDAAVIVCVTDSGATAAIFSHLRPRQPVLACTSDNRVARRLSLYWGVLPVVVGEQESVEDLLEAAIRLGLSRKLLRPGDRAVFTGNLSGRGGETNLLAVVEAASGQALSS